MLWCLGLLSTPRGKRGTGLISFSDSLGGWFHRAPARQDNIETRGFPPPRFKGLKALSP